MLGMRLQKFVAQRNISFNLRVVFKNWKESTEEWRKKNEGQITIIGRLRQFLKNNLYSDASKQSSSGQPAQSSEGKTTDEAQIEIKEEVREVGSMRADAKRADRFNNGEDHDQDIVEPDFYTKNKLIPNCFGVYKAN